MSISVVRKNVVANFMSNGWTALVAVLLIPLYIKFLGVEAWGVVGIYVSLQSVCTLLDVGLSASLNRELARLSLHKDKAQEMRNLVRTMELIYWSLAILAGATIFALAPVIARHWVRASQLSPAIIQSAIRLMGLTICLQWPFGLYAGGLSGLQRQVLLSGMSAGIAALRGLGAVLILWKISPTLHAFFWWQVGVSVLQTCLAGLFMWHNLPLTESASTFQSTLLRRTWRFTAGMSGFAIVSIIISQMDKVILSRMLSLEMFGYYVLAGAVATGIYLPVMPIFSALYPRFTQLVSLGDKEGLKELYHHGCQLMSVMILPISIVIVFFSKEILFIWTGNSTTVARTHLILSILVIGTALNGLIHLPHALQLAHGWTKLPFSLNLVLVIILVPGIILMTSMYGAVGAAFIWVIFNGALAIVGIQLMHRRLLRGEQWRWYFEDVGLPLAVSVGMALLCLLIVPTEGARIQLLMFLAGATLFVAGPTLLATPVTRAGFVSYVRSLRGRALNVSQ